MVPNDVPVFPRDSEATACGRSGLMLRARTRWPDLELSVEPLDPAGRNAAIEPCAPTWPGSTRGGHGRSGAGLSARQFFLGHEAVLHNVRLEPVSQRS